MQKKRVYSVYRCVCVCVDVYCAVFFKCCTVRVFKVYWCVCERESVLMCTEYDERDILENSIGSEADWPPTSESDRALLAQSYILLYRMGCKTWRASRIMLQVTQSYCISHRVSTTHVRHSQCQNVM